MGKLGRYRVLKELGRGGMGAVFLGYDSRLERKVALKIMLPRYAENADSRERFLREARTAAMVKSDHVVTIFDVGEEHGMPFIAMEYLLGCPLDQYLKSKGELPLAHALRIGRETALGLAAAHELGLVHRDIKPGNLWLESPKGRVKLLDFGLARVDNDDVQLTNTGALVGTPAYMSPEQARGEKVDHRSDLFSLGVLLHRLTTGQMPFKGSTTLALLTSLAVDTPPPLRELKPELPEALEQLVARLLAKQSGERIQSAKDVARLLRGIEAPKPAAGDAPGAAAAEHAPLAISAQTQLAWEGIDASRHRRERPQGKQTFWPAMLTVGVLLAALAAFAVVAMRSSPSPPRGSQVDTSGPAKAQRNSSKAAPQATTIAADPDRRAAEYVLSIGGIVRVNGEKQDIQAADLPKARFKLTYVSFSGNQKVNDGGLICFQGCKDLASLNVERTAVTDAGLVNFAGCTQLKALSLASTNVGNSGLAHFKNCNRLESLYLTNTLTTDVGIAHLKDCKSLNWVTLDGTQVGNSALDQLKKCSEFFYLNLKRTKVTAEKVAEFARAQPQCKIEHDGGTIEPTAVADPDRRAAQYVLSIGGWVQSDDKMQITSLADLPTGPFALKVVNLYRNKNVTDVGLAAFRDCRNLTYLVLQSTNVSDEDLVHFKDCSELGGLNLGFTQVGDAGLANFANCKKLSSLGLGGTRVTDGGLANFKDCENLKILLLDGVQVGDAGLAHFKACQRLTHLDVRKTNVTAQMIEEFRQALPQCKIEYDGGTIEPTVAADIDRRAAEYVLSLGGSANVYVDGKRLVVLPKENWDPGWGSSNDVVVVSNLPNEPFSLTHAALRGQSVTDAGLASFRGCKNLGLIRLDSAPNVSDAGLR